MPLLAAGCTIVTSGATPVMTVTVKDGESALITLRTSDNMVTVNGHVFSGTPAVDTNAPCDIAPTGTISIVADQTVMSVAAGHALGRTVILDYINGLFMTAASATTPGIKIDMTTAGDTGVLNWLKIRGSDGSDQFAIGAGTGIGAAAAFAFNANAKWGTATSQLVGTGGGTVALDGFADVTLKLVPKVMISSGAGDDRLDAEGLAALAGVGTQFPNPLQLFGGDGIDTITGGLAADTLSGGAGADVLNGCQGDDTYDMGSAASGADVIAQVCPPPTPPVVPPVAEGSDTVDYSKRTNAVTVNLSKTLNATNSGTDTPVSGETSGDGAHISDKIVTLRLGAGDDIVAIPSTSTVSHTVQGGAGDDQMTGGGVADTFDGGNGDDTCIGALGIMSYAGRTPGVTVTTCGGPSVTCTTTIVDANDGDQLATGYSQSGTAAATVLAGGVPVATITSTGFTSASVGNQITLSGCTAAADELTYPIVAVSDDGLVAKIDVTTPGSATFVASATCSYSEARLGTTAHTGTGAVTNDVISATVTGLDHLTNAVGRKLTLTTPVTPGTDDGVFHIVGVTGSVASIDKTTRPDGSAVTGFLGGVTGLPWTITGPERDNVQCANVIGGAGVDTITGDVRANNFRGGNGADILNGAGGSDTLIGEGGGDSLYGGAGDDTLVGGGGASTSSGLLADGVDSLFGGDGNDVLEGDTGADAFACDGVNSSTALTAGAAPGDSDITVDKVSGSDTGGADCEF